jgi:hypothetical protein
VKRVSTSAVLVLVVGVVCATAGVFVLSGGSGTGARAAAAPVGARLAAPGTWSSVPTPNPSPTQFNQFTGVSCVSGSFCMAAGSYQGESNESGLVSRWNGTSWSISPTPAPAPPAGTPSANAYELASVSCPSVTFCVAVGEQESSSGGVPLAEQWNGDDWSIVPMPAPGPSGTSPTPPITTGRPMAAALLSPRDSPLKSQGLNGVSCTGPNFCMAVGAVGSDKGDQAFGEEWDGSSWSIVSPATSSPAVPQVFEGVTCSSALFCVAVGTAEVVVGGGDTDQMEPLIDAWDGTSWSDMGAAAPPSGGLLLGVSCRGTTFCMADGYTKSDSGTEAITEVWNGSTWSEPSVPSVAGAAGSGLAGMSCVGPSLCVATGVTLAASGQQGTTLVLEWNGQDWTVEPSPSPGPSQNLNLLYAVSCVARQSCMAVGDDQDNTADTSLTLAEWAPLLTPGYYTVSAAGGVFSFGGAGFYGSTGSLTLNRPMVGMAATPDGGGYWLVASDGGIFAFGDAPFYGSTGSLTLDKPIVGMAPTPDGLGYWLVAADGGVFAFGDAGFYGSTGGMTLDKPIVGMAATPDGRGYWLVASDGGVFAFGDAGFYGSTGGMSIAKPMVGMAATPDGRGYWLVAADGGVFAVGDAGFYGSAAGVPLAGPMVGMAATTDGLGYWLVGSDGGIFNAGDAAFGGSASGLSPGSPVVGMAA